MRVLSFLNRMIYSISGVLLAIMTSLVLIQILFRYVLNLPLSYTEELARYAMIWTVMIGATVAYRNKSHIGIGFFVSQLPNKLQLPIRIIQNLAVLVFCAILLIQGYKSTLQSMSQLATASKISVGWIMASIPTSGLIIILYIIEDFFKEVKFFNNQKTDSKDNQKEDVGKW